MQTILAQIPRIILWPDVLAVLPDQRRPAVELFRQAVGVSRRTLGRWERGEARVPRSVYLAALYAAGDLRGHGREWEGLRVVGPAVVGTPYGAIHAAEVRALPWLRAIYNGEPVCVGEANTPRTKSDAGQEKEASQ